MTNHPTLQITNLTAGYNRFPVLDSFSLQLERGSCIAVLGPNGAGKSTLLRTIMGQVSASSGEIKIDGINVLGLPPHRIAKGLVSLVPEGRRLFVYQSVEDNLLLGGFHLRKQPRRIAGLLESVYNLFPKLTQYRTRSAGALSGGEQQMVAIGRALMADPKVLLLDEPSLGLAPLAVADVIRGLLEVRSTGISLLVVEQKLDLALKVSDEVCVMKRGELMMQKSTSAIDSGGVEDLIAAYLD